jgi:SprT protein
MLRSKKSVILPEPLPQLLSPESKKTSDSISVSKLEVVFRKPRKSKLGDYRYFPFQRKSLITLNSDLEPNELRLVYLHELAHYFTFKKYGRKVKPHGLEWKEMFKTLLLQELSSNHLSELEEHELREMVKKPKATSSKIIEHNANDLTVDKLEENTTFLYKTREFKVEKRLRKRYLCTEIKTGKQYRFHPLCVVELT